MMDLPDEQQAVQTLAFQQLGHTEAQAKHLAQQLAARPTKRDIGDMIREYELKLYRKIWALAIPVVVALIYRILS
ncbi:MAG: hypothetical protein F4Y95_07330 [Chloroflexi bacterium]|nr:hypothetical protein [Chloroflexota bacterium]